MSRILDAAPWTATAATRISHYEMAYRMHYRPSEAAGRASTVQRFAI